MSSEVDKRNVSLKMQHILQMNKIKPSTTITKGNKHVMQSYKRNSNLEFKLKTYDVMKEKLFKGKGIDYKYANGNYSYNRVTLQGKVNEIEKEDVDGEADVSFSLVNVDVVSIIYICYVCVNVVLGFSMFV